MKPLEGHVAVVAGATRGGARDRADARRSGRHRLLLGPQQPAPAETTDHHYAGRPETIEETAELVTAAGGVGIAVRVDHTVDAEVAALFARVRKEQKRLDVLVNILTGKPVASWKASGSCRSREPRVPRRLAVARTSSPAGTRRR